MGITAAASADRHRGIAPASTRPVCAVPAPSAEAACAGVRLLSPPAPVEGHSVPLVSLPEAVKRPVLPPSATLLE